MAPKKTKGDKPQEETFDSEKGFVAPKNKGGRPRVYVPKTSVTRETRVPLDGIRDVLPNIEADKDPNFYYYWATDSDENGTQILHLMRAGYNFVQSKEVNISKTNVYSSHDVGSIIRIPNRDGTYNFLMKQPMQWHKEDEAARMKRIDEMEKQTAADRFDGSYGSITIGSPKVTR